MLSDNDESIYDGQEEHIEEYSYVQEDSQVNVYDGKKNFTNKKWLLNFF